MSLDSIVNVQIDRQTTALSRVGFGTPMVLGEHTNFTERIKFFASQQEVLDEGFLSTDPIAVATSKLFAQEIVPPTVAIGRRTADVAQVNTVTVDTVADATDYTVTINGTDFTFNSGVGATAASISAGLDGLINAGSEPVTSLDGGGSLTLTADVAGDAFTLSVSANMSFVVTTANEDVAFSIQQVEDESADWYALILDVHNDRDTTKAANDIEARRKIFLTSSSNADIPTSATSDLGSTLNALNLQRTSLMYHEDPSTFPEAAWAGRILPEDPGSVTWAFFNLQSVAKSVTPQLTGDQRTNLLAKKVNFIQEIAGVDVTQGGFMIGGEFMDIIRGIDNFTVRLQERIFDRLVNLPKIPFTDAGIAIIEGEIRAQIADGQGDNFIALDPEPTVTVPKAVDVSSIDRANRLLPDVEFTFRAAGAIHQVDINGVVTV